jgi:hypothetical protein
LKTVSAVGVSKGWRAVWAWVVRWLIESFIVRENTVKLGVLFKG